MARAVELFREQAARTMRAAGRSVMDWGAIYQEPEPAAVERAAAGAVRRTAGALGARGRHQRPAVSIVDPLPAAEAVVDELGALAPADDSRGNPVSSRFVYEALVRVALHEARRRGYRARPSQVTFLASTERMAEALGIGRRTLLRRLGTLRDLGLVDARRWRAPVDAAVLPAAAEAAEKARERAARDGARTRRRRPQREDGAVEVTGGTLFAVRLAPGRARLTVEDFGTPWRDLEADIRAGRTWRRASGDAVAALEGPSDAKGAADRILSRALPPRPEQNPRCPNAATSESADLAELFDLPGLARVDRSERVDAVARTLAATLRDADNLNAHRWAIWQALRLADQGQTGALAALWHAAQRVRHDMADPAAELRRPGARFVALLRADGWWDALKSAPATRVGAVRA